MGGCGIPVVVLTLVGNRSFGCHGEKLDSRADNVLRPVGNEIRVQKAAAAKSFFLGFADQGLEVAPQSAVRCHHRYTAQFLIGYPILEVGYPISDIRSGKSDIRS